MQFVCITRPSDGSPRRVPCLTPKLEASTASTVGATRTGRCGRRGGVPYKGRASRPCSEHCINTALTHTGCSLRAKPRRINENEMGKNETAGTFAAGSNLDRFRPTSRWAEFVQHVRSSRPYLVLLTTRAPPLKIKNLKARRRSRTEQTARIAPHNILCAANRNQVLAPQELENRLAPRAPRRLGQPCLNLVRRLRPAGGGCCGAGCGATVM